MLNIIANQAVLSALRARLPHDVATALVSGALGAKTFGGNPTSVPVYKGESRTNTKQESLVRKHRCPIPGCNYVFEHGATGWAKHVGSPSNHEGWLPDTAGSDVRKATFEAQFPEFFNNVRRVTTPPPVGRPISNIAPPRFATPTQPPTSTPMLGLEAMVRRVVREELAKMLSGAT